MTTRMQHYVWRKYLEGWQQSSGQIYCSRKGTIFKSNPAKVLRKRDYYSLSRITRTDVAFLDAMFRETNPELRKLHRSLIESWGYIANANHVIQTAKYATEEERKYTNDLVIEAEENLQSGIENQALPILEQLRHEQTDFLSDYDSTMGFFRFFSHQYMRTRALRERIGKELGDSLLGRDFEHLKHLMCHCTAENLGASLFVDRSTFEIVFLRSATNNEFITGDQPIVNLFRAHSEDSPPTELALYYPLRPDLSMILLPKAFGLSSVNIPRAIVDELNGVIVQKASEFLVAKQTASLRGINFDLHEGQRGNGYMLLERIKNIAMSADNVG